MTHHQSDASVIAKFSAAHGGLLEPTMPISLLRIVETLAGHIFAVAACRSGECIGIFLTRMPATRWRRRTTAAGRPYAQTRCATLPLAINRSISLLWPGAIRHHGWQAQRCCQANGHDLSLCQDCGRDHQHTSAGQRGTQQGQYKNTPIRACHGLGALRL